MKKLERMTKAELIRRINALEKGAPSASIAFEHERLNHELQVHQLELETQNSELREAQRLLEVSRNRYADLYDFAPVGYATFDSKGVILEINLTASGMLGMDRTRLTGVPFRLHILSAEHNLFRKHLKKRTHPDAVVHSELHIKRSDKTVVPVSVQSVVFHDEERGEDVYRAAITDITARIEAERMLYEAAELNQGILSSLTAHIAVLDGDGTIIAVNTAWNRFAVENGDTNLARTGVGTNYLEVCKRAEAHGKEAFDGVSAVLNGSGPHFHLEYPCDSPKVPRWFQMSVTPLARAMGGAVISHWDITARKQLEETIRDREARLRAVISTAADGIITIDEKGVMESVNTCAQRIFGYTSNEMIGSNVSMLMPSPHDKKHDDYLAGYRNTGERKVIGIGREVEGRRKDGSTFPMELNIGEVTLSGQRIFTGFVRDITKRRKTETALREEKDFISAVLETAGALVVVLDEKGRVVRFNRACEQLTGYAAEHVVGKTFWELKISADASSLVRSEFTRLKKTRRSGTSEYYWQTRDGQKRLISWSNTVLTRPDGKVKYVIGTGVDITERKEANDALCEQTLRYQSLLDVSPDAIYVVRNGLIEFTNPEGIRLLGLRVASEVVGKSPFEFFKTNRQEIIRQRIDSISGDGTGVNISPLVEERFTRPDGSICWVAVTSAMFQDSDGTALLLVLRNITDHRRLENEILEIGDREQQNLGHELHDGLGQQLTALEMRLYLLKEDLAREDLTSIRRQLQKEARNLGMMLRDCITLTRSLARGLTTISLKANALSDSLKELAFGASVKGKIECHFRCDTPLALNNTQTVKHLYRIAQEAVNNALKHACAKHIEIKLEQENDSLRMLIKDDGRGVPRRRKEKSGMGLEIMRHRANIIGAQFQVESVRGQGVTVKCELPLHNDEH